MKKVFALLLVVLFTSFAFAKTAPTKKASAPAKPTKLVVEIADFKPCVVVENDKISGFEIDLWQAIAKDNGFQFEYKVVPFEQILKDMSTKKADVGIAGITISEKRNEKFDFTFHNLDSGLRIMTPKVTKTYNFYDSVTSLTCLKAFKKSMANPVIFEYAMYFLMFLIIFAHVIWWSERGGTNDGISEKYYPGIFEAIYFCIVTMSTVGYGDYTCKNKTGKAMCVMLIVCGVVMFANYTALLSADYAVDKITGSINCPEDLRHKKVATIEGTTSVDALKKIGAVVVPVKDIDEASLLLDAKRIDAVVFDSPIVLNYVQKSDEKYETAGEIFDQQYYGFALPKNSQLRTKINKSLLKFREDGTYKIIYDKWFSGLKG